MMSNGILAGRLRDLAAMLQSGEWTDGIDVRVQEIIPLLDLPFEWVQIADSTLRRLANDTPARRASAHYRSPNDETLRRYRHFDREAWRAEIREAANTLLNAAAELEPRDTSASAEIPLQFRTQPMFLWECAVQMRQGTGDKSSREGEGKMIKRRIDSGELKAMRSGKKYVFDQRIFPTLRTN